MKIKTPYKIIISAFIFGCIIYFIDFNDVILALKKTSLLHLAIGIILSHISWILSGYKLHILYQRDFIESVELHYKSILFSFILPGQMGGEGYKILKMSRNIGLSNSASIVLIDRLTGFIGILILSGIGILYSNELFPIELKIIIWSLLILFPMPFIFSNLFKKILISINNKIHNDLLNSILKKVLSLMDSFIEIKSRSWVLRKCIFMGIIFQLISIYINMYIGESLGIDVAFYDWFWIFGLISLALFLPVTYAGFGIREGSMVGLLGIFSVDPEKAIALSFLILALQLTGVFVGFLWNLKKENK